MHNVVSKFIEAVLADMAEEKEADESASKERKDEDEIHNNDKTDIS
jgi:hypothetical protein